MAKIITDVLLKDGTDETTFINDVTSNDEVDLKDRVTSLNNMVVLSVEHYDVQSMLIFCLNSLLFLIYYSILRFDV